MRAIAKDNYKMEVVGKEPYIFTKGKSYVIYITAVGVLINDDNKRAKLMCKEEVENKFDIIEKEK